MPRNERRKSSRKGFIHRSNQGFRGANGNRAGNRVTSKPLSQFSTLLAPLSCYLRDLGIKPFPLRWIPSRLKKATESLSRDDFCASGSFCLSGSGPLCAFGVSNCISATQNLSHQITIVDALYSDRQACFNTRRPRIGLLRKISLWR